MSPSAPSAPTDASPRRRRRLPLLAVAVAVVLAGAAAVVWWTGRADASWSSVTTASGRFAVDLPGEPTRAGDDVAVGGRSFGIDLLTVGDLSLEGLEPGVLFLEVDLADQPELAAAASDPNLGPTLLYAQAGSVFAAAGVTLGPMQIAPSDLGPALDLDGTVPGRGLVVRGWTASADGAVIAALVVADAEDRANADADLARIVASVEPA